MSEPCGNTHVHDPRQMMKSAITVGWSAIRKADTIWVACMGRRNRVPSEGKNRRTMLRSTIHPTFSSARMVNPHIAITGRTHKSFPELMHDLVFEPLGMTHSTFEVPLRKSLWPEAAKPYA